MPHKKFQHFIKWFDIFIRAKTNIQKKKGKIKQKNRKILTCRPGEDGPPSPAGPQGQQGLLPRPVPPSCSVQCHRASRGRHVAVEGLPGLPVPPSRAWRRPGARLLHSPLQRFFPSSYAQIRRRPKLHRSAPPWTTWPPCPRAPTSKSTVFLVLDFVFTQKLEP